MKANIETAKGQIVDTDFATETAKLARAQILMQAATAMLAQANASKNQTLQTNRGVKHMVWIPDGIYSSPMDF